MTDKKIEVAYANGYLHGRVVFEDYSEGHMQLKAGAEYRIRVGLIAEYSAAEAGVVLLSPEHMPERQVALIGTVKGVDEVIKRHEMRQVKV